jgi:hypothetical protein
VATSHQPWLHVPPIAIVIVTRPATVAGPATLIDPLLLDVEGLAVRLAWTTDCDEHFVPV